MNGRIAGTVKVVDNGPGNVRWDLVILGDGFVESELPGYELVVRGVVDALFAAAPFTELRGAINIHRVDGISDESGIEPNVTRRTVFNSNFGGGLSRLILADRMAVVDVVTREVPLWNATLLIVNSTTYGGSGGFIPVVSTAASVAEVALHEMGHSHFLLADEYPYYAGCSELGHDRYSGAEPAEPNVTRDKNGAKWRHLIATGTRIPTTRNANCTRCDAQASPVPAATVGTFEGARYFKCGLFRPSFNCRMNVLGQPFCAVCQDAIRNVLTPFVPPPVPPPA